MYTQQDVLTSAYTDRQRGVDIFSPPSSLISAALITNYLRQHYSLVCVDRPFKALYRKCIIQSLINIRGQNLINLSCVAELPPARSNLNHLLKVKYSVSEFNEFKPRLKSSKNLFQLSAGLNLEKFNTILSGTNHGIFEPRLKLFKFARISFTNSNLSRRGGRQIKYS